KAAAARALRDGQTKYSPVAGLAALREAVRDKLERENGLVYDTDQIVIGNGGKHAAFNVIMAVCREGDEVIIPAPYWLSYPEMVRVAGAVSVIVPGAEADGFKLTPERLREAVTARTRLMILNSPANPSGVVYTEDELRGLCEVAVERGIMILSDEIYERMVYDGARHVSVGSLSEAVFRLTITLNGFSKSYAMTGWRLGYAAGPAPVMRAVCALQSHSTSGPNTFAQYGALAAARGEAEAECRVMMDAFAERRAALCRRLDGMDRLSYVKPEGAFYALPNIGAFGLAPSEFARRLLEEAAVAVVPGEPFGAPEHVRISYACGREEIGEGLDRLERFIASL
ncbi:MAG: pyridoxal phosphate-dependent aminotransferase, partial [Lentisphaerae bacterium]|nr:pyridoxal phosphate-dependent aminotransferase [Lentisphaerota bacterium]